MKITYSQKGISGLAGAACVMILFLLPLSGKSQVKQPQLFKEVSLRIDTAVFSTTSHTIEIGGIPHLYFEYDAVNAVCEVKVFPLGGLPFADFQLLPSGDFEVVDSLMNINNDHYRFKVKFKQLTTSDFLQFTFSVKTRAKQDPFLYELRLFPLTKTSAFLKPKDNKLFIGEERTFKVETNRPNNIKYSNQWSRGKNIDYKFSNRQGELLIHLLPNQPGTQILSVPLVLKKPMLLANDQVVYELPPLEYTFDVKESKLVFLNTNKKEVSLKNDQIEGIEIEMEYHPSVELKKTYRLEKQEEAGGQLIAEIFTRSILANGRILCWLRPFNQHRQSENYLYIKDGDVAKFITNFSITPATHLANISVLVEKGNESKGNVIFPGENISIKLTGEGLHKAKFSFDGLKNVQTDTLIRGENELIFNASVPLDINRTKIDVLNYGVSTGKALNVQEFQTPHPLNFIQFSTGKEENFVASEIDKTIFVDHTLEDIVLIFDNNKIDSETRLFGKQYLTIDIQISGMDNHLIDKRSIQDIVVCPGEESPRFAYYDPLSCRQENISLNQYIRLKTFDLEEWSTIEITIRHDPTKHGSKGFQKKAEFILRRYTTFNLEVSFPAGLLTKKVGQAGFGSLGGVSMAMIAQFSFYHPRRIAKYRPYKFGAGFLAFNAFNFSENSSNRDVGVVVLASLYPIRTKNSGKLSFPLFLGGGYFLSESKFFYLLGPGIRLSL
ncbi:MAG: hypothetical protein DHS20C18_35060 [Saprospiraceae bacterium]|nr:MAG: hypothetical protein DHS20C18_35060 [Saprospiraceae bacterium]